VQASFTNSGPVEVDMGGQISARQRLAGMALAAGLCLLAACGPEGPPQEEVGSGAPEVTAAPEVTDAPGEDPFEELRAEMVEHTIAGRGVNDADVLRAMRTVPRHAFVEDDDLGRAYADHPLPIGYGQTISQPYIVAWMTELLLLEPGDKVLELGTGSGYQAAVLAELGFVEVYSLEIVEPLAAQAAERLTTLGYENLQSRQGDGYYGWEEYAPFDAIIVTAAPDHLPAPLVAQTKIGGRIVIPIGPPGGYQSLWQFVKESDTEIKAYNMGGVRFVPFTGEGVQGAE
jgi:protein-L-isoaspartate(D-aspartate) O-methyltransferase